MSDEQTFPVPLSLIEDAIDALSDQAENDRHWQGIRDSRYDYPRLAADRLRAIIGWGLQLTPEETAAAHARMDAERVRGLARMQEIRDLAASFDVEIPGITDTPS